MSAISVPDWFCPLPLDCGDTYGRLTIASVSLHGPAWCAHDLSSLYDTPAFRDGPNVMVEGVAGSSARPVTTDETEVSLPVMFSGATTQAGVAHANPAGGLLANRRTFTSTFIAPIRTSAVSLAAVLTVPPVSGSTMLTYTFNVQPLRLSGWALLPGAYARAVLELRIPVPNLLDGAGT